jgi:hypothetical protein
MRVVNRQCIVVLSILPVVLCLLMKKDSSYTLTPRPQTARIGGVLFTIIVVVAVLYFAQDVLMPLALGVLLAFLLRPDCAIDRVLR